jgi:hypothetical protein
MIKKIKVKKQKKIKISKKDKIENLDKIIETTNLNASQIQKKLKGTPYAIRKQIIFQRYKAQTIQKFTRVIIADHFMHESTKERIIKVIKKEYRKGKIQSINDMMNNLYRLRTPFESPYILGY